MRSHHKMLQGTPSQFSSVTLRDRASRRFISRGKRNLRSRFLRHVIADHRVETMQTADLAKVDLLSSPHALKKCGLFEIVETTMQSFSAFYEDAAKTEAAARLEGYDGENGSLMDYVEPSDYLTGKRFQGIVEAEEWLKSEIAAMKTVFGSGTIRKLESVGRRCRYCTCRGVKAVHDYTVDDTGIVEDEVLDDDCVD